MPDKNMIWKFDKNIFVIFKCIPSVHSADFRLSQYSKVNFHYRYRLNDK